MESGAGLRGRILVVAGEASGDQHAADLLAAVHLQAPGLQFFGMGGRRLLGAGMETVQEIRHLSVMGFAEVMGSGWRLLAAYRRLRRILERQRPLAVLLVDFPDFNLPLARAASRLGIPAIYFISPQIWAWRQGRVKTLVRHVRRVICILPFEAELYQRHGGRAVYVGHPLMDQVAQVPDARQSRRRLGVPESGTVLALIPGSRRQEVRILLPEMLAAAERLQQSCSLSALLLPVAPTLNQDDVVRAAGGRVDNTGLKMVPDAFLDVLAAADIALVASGTSTLAAAVV
ncbi:MAG: lipid-A-disaccharide synthase, partial [Acidobacteriota bacterium]